MQNKLQKKLTFKDIEMDYFGNIQFKGQSSSEDSSNKDLNRSLLITNKRQCLTYHMAEYKRNTSRKVNIHEIEEI